ncbi:cytotoxic translational repressor of toxin-antitoxin stability system [Oligella urethralis]|nr:cytotoxic translational repressor of toxin-antitoxin stability system [Oligella urethralis]
MFKINWVRKAAKQLAKLDRREQQRIISAVDTLMDLPNARNVKQLINHQYGYRLRVGQYRVRLLHKSS